ncbi:MAG: hypothetical protein ACTSVM_02705, partial [Candidatus Ranarchaeia archaeon]
MHALLLKAWENERATQAPCPLDEEFWISVSGYIKQLEQRLNNIDPSSVTAPILQQELRNSRYMVHDIFQIRLYKILNTLSAYQIYEEITEYEKWAIKQFRAVMTVLDQ